MNRLIPKGSEIRSGNDFVAVIVRDLKIGDVPVSDDFDPPIPNGTEIEDYGWYFQGVLIYKNGKFV